MNKALVVDCDGMLIKADQLFSEQFAQEHNLSIDQVAAFFTGPFKRCLTGHADITLVIRPYLREWGWQGSVQSFLDYWFKTDSQIDLRIINYLKNFKQSKNSLYLATNQEKYRLQFLADDLDFLSLFDHIFASCEIGFKKPQVEFYQYIFKSVQYLDAVKDPSEVMYWDDQPEKVKAAKKFGFDSHQYIEINDFIQTINSSFRTQS